MSFSYGTLRGTGVPLRVSGASKENLFYNWAVSLDFFYFLFIFHFIFYFFSLDFLKT